MAFEWKWLRSDFDDPSERGSFAALRIAFGDQLVTRIYDHVSGGERDAVNIPLYSLALCIAENWWTLLHEPRKKAYEDDYRIETRHSLDAYVHGFAFPAMTIWSAGEDAIIVETPDIQQQFFGLEFFSQRSEATILPRAEFEQNLFSLVTSVVDRVCRNGTGAELREAWDRVLASLNDIEELKYCLAAGRIGTNPYMIPTQ